jgi:hypothetical protein
VKHSVLTGKSPSGCQQLHFNVTFLMETACAGCSQHLHKVIFTQIIADTLNCLPQLTNAVKSSMIPQEEEVTRKAIRGEMPVFTVLLRNAYWSA